MTDEVLILQLKNGDMDAFKLLVNKHKDFAFTIAYRIVHSTENAEEVVQDAFLKFYKSISKFKGDAKFTTWFYRIVFNTAISSGRKKKLDTAEINKEAVSFGTTDRDSLLADERKQFIHQALAKLSDEDKLMLTLFYFDEMSLEEIAEITSSNASNLKVRLFRARKKLALELQSILKEEVTSLL